MHMLELMLLIIKDNYFHLIPLITYLYIKCMLYIGLKTISKYESNKYIKDLKE